MAVILETSLGDITVDLYTDERPRSCLNFLKLCKMKYYNFCLFHSVQRNLVAQTGDPSGTGKGGSSVYGPLYGEQARYYEAEVKPRIKHTKLGSLSMVNNGDNMHGSQFFLTLSTDIDYLDNKHTVFGEVAEGFETLQKFNEVFADQDGRPYKDVRIFHTVILDDPFDDPDGLAAHIPDRSPEPTREQLDSGRIRVDENIDDFEGKTEAEIQELVEEREAKARTQILEMVGDIPDTEVAPPDTVLFVCKLNPVTTSEDLEIIFSRFGDIKSCEVIKDQKTGESLQYAFIEFEKPEECENAYFKMDNVLIDDRRIHVDFSQSVSKFKWKGKGKGVEQIKDSDHGDEDSKPQFVIKGSKRKDKYDLVFDSDEEPHRHRTERSNNTKQREKPSRRNDSESDGDDCRKERKKYKTKHHDNHRQTSDKHKKNTVFNEHATERRRSRSRSRDRHRHHRDRSSERRTGEKERKHHKSHHRRDRSRSPKRHQSHHHEHHRQKSGSGRSRDY